ncbi:nucleoid-associated protein, YbaB/EbfC family [Helicobacter monodelphidis]|uniref:YbaB/EbfC family nucleoid-associated protein n=1 Tax=Helicobacter sp. 15-1451 TaxID=2004995 RepID=UPI000DCCBF5E|nr:YbaB/EbfC family nucleoid-associated protein [Helicobacter sp. 15-1451]RAX59232.1 nucleoid-associated protein, YbaB/EbfC family [Helicobacter sp. 15-1451]
MFDMGQLSSMMNELQNKSKEIEEQSQSRLFTAKGGGGLVSVSANGKGEIVDIVLDDSLLEDKESLQILLISTVNDVLRSVEADRHSTTMGLLDDLVATSFKG